MRFIVLTWQNGRKVRINVQHIVEYYLEDNVTTIELSRDFLDDVYSVKETPEEIDSLLITNGILVHE